MSQRMEKTIIFMALIVIFSIISLWIPQDINACTAFKIKYAGDIFVGKNYDWIVGEGLIVVNKRGVSKTAVPTFFDKKYESEKFVSWKSKYGSVTFNQFGREWPFGGINEAGLVVEGLAFPDTETPEPDSRSSISALQLCQFHLDNFSSVKEVINSEKLLRIMPSKLPAGHLFITDTTGNTAVIEYINGKQIYYTDESMPYEVLTNSAYAKSIEFYRKNKIPRRDKGKSIERFISAARMLQNYDADTSTSLLDYSFKILENVSWKEKRSLGKLNILMETKWSIVYDVNRLRIYFRTSNNPNIRMINLKSFDFACATPIKVLDINTRISGDVTGVFTVYTPQINNTLVKTVFEKTPYPFLYGLDFKFFVHLIKSGFSEFPEHPAKNIETLITYPDTTVCTKQNM